VILPNAHIRGFEPVPRTPAGRVGRIVRLGHNERTVPLAGETVHAMLARISPEDLTALPELGPLYQKVAGFLGVDMDAVIVTHGADTGINSVFHAYVGTGDEVILPALTYHRYLEFCCIYGATPVTIGFSEETRLDFDAMMSSIRDGTKLVVIVNPSSSTGSRLELAQISAAAACARSHGALVLVDEVYHHYCPVTAIPLLPEYDNIVVVRSFSKAFGLAGTRVGMLIGSSEVVHQLRKLKQRHEISIVSARIAEYMLDHPEIMEGYVATVRGSQAKLVAELARHGLRTISGETPSVLLQLPGTRDREDVAARLWEAGYEVAAGMPAPFERYLRVTVGPWNQMEGFVRALTQILAD
jgi:histidinol-phosphate aminotransferase